MIHPSGSSQDSDDLAKWLPWVIGIPFGIGIGVLTHNVLVGIVAGLGGAGVVSMLTEEYLRRRARRRQEHLQKSTQIRKPATQTRKQILFKDVGSTASRLSLGTDLAGILDAFTGEPLNPALGLYRCQCQVFYSASSFDFLREENGGRCVSCKQTSIVPFARTDFGMTGVSCPPEIVTLSNYPGYAGRVVTFEGYVRRISASRTGRAYAIMFEDKTWTRGLKAVVFTRHVVDVGGTHFINGLSGKTIRVRGLLQRHDIYGYQIVVTRRSMILEVR